MSTALAFDAQHRPPASAAARVREPAPAAAAIAAAAPLAGWSAPRRPRSFWLLVAGLHLVGGWALAHSLAAPMHRPAAEPIQVRVIAPPPPPPPRVEVPPMKMPTVPLAAVIPPPQFEVASPVVVAATVSPPAVAPVAAAPARVAEPAAIVAAAVSPAAPRQLPPSAVRYLVPPQPVMPRMSRRLGESGLVVLHIAVDAQGRLKSVTVKKSSGFERLDQQALLDMRGARFAPYLEQGQPVEWEADAGLQYELSAH